jgi:hypothetical protein
MNLECPSCHQATIPVWRKLFLGPATSAACPSCGSRISVPYWAMLAAIPFAAGFVAAQVVGSFAVAAGLVIAGSLVMAWIHYKFVPLIVK